MRVAVTGTPGVGKTSACALVKAIKVVHVNDLAEQAGACTGYDKKRGTKEVDVAKLRRTVSEIKEDVVLEGHLSHYLSPDLAIVLRCSPSVLEGRLKRKRWSEGKVRENVEAEAVDVVLIEALEEAREVCEIDTTEMSPRDVARAIEDILKGKREKYRVGDVDWSQEVLSWF